MKKLDAIRREDLSSLLEQTEEILARGGVVSLPTETVYGLAVVSTDREAVRRLREIKRCGEDKPFTLAFADAGRACSFLSVMPPYGYRLMESYWPGPLTVIYYSLDGEKVGIRIPAHRFILALLNRFSRPLYLSSANISGSKEAVTAGEVELTFGKNIDLVVDGGPAMYSRASTVIDLTYHPFKILREGAVPVRDIVDLYVRKRLVFVCTGNTCRSVMAEYLLRKYLMDYDYNLARRYEIISRGIHAYEGSGASSSVIDILGTQEGINGVRAHVSHKLDRHTILSSDLIFTMEEEQRDFIIRQEPTAEARVFPLRKFLPADMEKDIIDPIGKSEEVYQQVYENIKEAVCELRDWL